MGNLTGKRVMGSALASVVVAFLALMFHPRTETYSLAPSCGSDTTTRVVALINDERFKAGVPAVSCDSRLLASSSFHTTWMVNHKCLSHACPGEPSMWDRIQGRGYPVLYEIGETAGSGQQTPKDIMFAWLSSSPHRDILLYDKYRDIGCAENATYWTCDFAFGGPASKRWFAPHLGR